MFSDPQYRGKGYGERMLVFLIDQAKAEGISLLNLETGAWEYFIPARSLYRNHGFVICPPFSDYQMPPDSVFMTREI
jgi:putative acetyltransferase